MIPKILIVDNEIEICEIVEKILRSKNYICSKATTINEAKELLKKEFYDVIISDLIFPEGSGFDILKFKNEYSPESMFIFLSGYGTAEDALKSLQMGAFDYISKPFRNVELLMVVEKALQTKNLLAEEEALRKIINSQDSVGLIYKSKKMAEIVNLAKKVAKSSIDTILIEGETGVGKEVLAKFIHKMSNRANKPFIDINCAALPESLLESELFGYEKGAFTGATEPKKGLFEVANSGIIFLDEIGEISPKIQAKLLRFIEDKSFFRIGGVKKVYTDVVIIASTNRNLEKEINTGNFRADLYYRLKVISFYIPPLRERKEDIMALIEYYIDYYNNKFHKNINHITNEAKEVLLNYHWPGNVRELKNVIERIVLIENDNTIGLRHIPLEMLTVPQIDDLTVKEKDILTKFETLEKMEEKYIRKVLNIVKNKSKAAEILGINRKTLWEKIKKYKIET